MTFPRTFYSKDYDVPQREDAGCSIQDSSGAADAAAAHSKTGADAPAACAGCVHDDPHADRTSTPCTTATRRLADVSRTFNQWLTYGQAAALIAIAVAAIRRHRSNRLEMIAARSISLGDPADAVSLCRDPLHGEEALP